MISIDTHVFFLSVFTQFFFLCVYVFRANIMAVMRIHGSNFTLDPVMGTLVVGEAAVEVRHVIPELTNCEFGVGI